MGWQERDLHMVSAVLLTIDLYFGVNEQVKRTAVRPVEKGLHDFFLPPPSHPWVWLSWRGLLESLQY